MFRNYLKVAFRHIIRHKGYTSINIAGLSLAMACCLLILILVQHELSFDRFNANAERIYLLAHKENLATGEQVLGTEMAPLGPALKQNVAGINDYVRTFEPQVQLSFANTSARENVLCADRSFFQVFSFPLVQGDSLQALADPHSIVLSETAARKWFGATPAIGKTLMLENAFALTVTGVMRDLPANSTIRTDYVIPFLLLKEVGFEIDEWQGFDYATYLLLNTAAEPPQVAGNIDAYCADLYKTRNGKSECPLSWFLQPMTRLHLHSLSGQHNLLQTVYILIAVALAILLIACINFVNITTARSSTRAREIGLRKVAGAQRFDVVKQFVGESLLQTIIALVLAVALVEILLPVFGQLAGTNLVWHTTSLPALTSLLILGLTTAVIAGIYPAVHFSAYQPTAILNEGRSGRGGLRFRRLLVVLQFSVFVVLTTGAFIVAGQMHYIETKDLGFDRNNILGFMRTAGIAGNFESFRQELLSDPSVRGVSVAVQNVANVSSTLGPSVDWDGKDPNSRLEMHFDWVGYDYAQTLDIKMAQGRFYSREFPSDAVDGIVLNERAVKLMGLTDPIGKRFTYWGKQKRIIGVTRDFFFQPLNETLKPMVLIYGSAGDIVYVRISPTNRVGTLARIEKVFKKFDPGAAFDYTFFDDRYNRHYAAEQRMLLISRYAVIVAIVIACLGLFGLSAYTAERRTKEIGIRKVLGASTVSVLALLTKESLVLVALANIIAWPAAYIIGDQYLQRYAYRAGIGVMPFVLAAVLALVAALATVSFQAVRATRANPVDSLKYE